MTCISIKFQEIKIKEKNVDKTTLDMILLQLCSTQAMLNRVGYSPEISHGVLVEMAEHQKDLEKKTKPILDTLRSYQDLPPVCFLIDYLLDLFCSIISTMIY